MSSSSEWWKALWHAKGDEKRAAILEVAVIGGISLSPLILAGMGTFLGEVVNKQPNGFGFWHHLTTPLLSGQLLLYAMSFVGAVVWHSSYDLKRAFPLRIYFWFISLVFGITCGLIIGVDPSLQKLGVPEVYWTSIFVYIVSAILYCLILMFRSIDFDSFEKTLRVGEEEMIDDLKAERGLQ
jgi:hypothetical protein